MHVYQLNQIKSGIIIIITIAVQKFNYTTKQNYSFTEKLLYGHIALVINIVTKSWQNFIGPTAWLSIRFDTLKIQTATLI